MWSLPDIRRLNEEAVRNASKLNKAIETGYLNGIKIKCDWCDKPAEYTYPWYDVFSNVPKGIIGLCEEHDHYFGNPSEGFFTCDDCGKVFITNYTWENYYTDAEDGDRLCLNCALDRHIEEKEHWITSLKEINWEKVRTSPHVIPVKGKHWQEHLEFIGNVELDIYTGAKITGFSSTSSRKDGLNDLRDLVKQALIGHRKCILIMDATYQFAVSIGVYVKK